MLGCEVWDTASPPEPTHIPLLAGLPSCHTYFISRGGVVYVHVNLWIEELHPKSPHEDYALPPHPPQTGLSTRECGSVPADTKSHSYDVVHIPDEFAFSPRFVRKILGRCYIKNLYVKI